jgi:hypothetical protein
MSLLDEATTQQVVYGPDGKAYGNPAIARNAGVNQYYREDGTPYPVAQQTLPMPAPSFGGLGGTDPYSRIMSQMGAGTPYQRIMGQMPLLQNPYASMSGGYNNFQGGYNPNLYSNAPRAIGQLGFGGGGGGGGSEPAAPSAWSSMTPAEQAAYYAANPTMATITQLGQKAFGYTGLGALQRAMNPGFVTDQSLIAMGVNPAAYQASIQSMQDAYNADMAAAQAGVDAAQNAQSMQSMQDAYNSDMAAASGGFDGYSGGGFTSSDTGVGNPGESYGGPTSSDSGVGNPGESGGGYGASGDGDSGFAKGGKVTKSRLKGPDPKGPDEGYGALLSGEYVIKKSAVKKYGAGLLDMINAGKIPAKKMKSLLG